MSDYVETARRVINDLENEEVFEMVATEPVSESVPPAISKATEDVFDYAVGLRDGTVIRFQRAVVHGPWVALYFVEFLRGPCQPPAFFTFERGLEIRLSDIVWATDAPIGS